MTSLDSFTVNYRKRVKRFKTREAVAHHNAGLYDSSQVFINPRICSADPYFLIEEELLLKDMSRSPHRTWYPIQGSGAPPPTTSDRPSPGYDRGPPPEWYRWHDQQRGRSPPRKYSPRPSTPRGDHSVHRPPSPLGERSRRSPSPRNDMPPSPRGDQALARRPSPIHAPNQSLRDRIPSPRRERPPSPRRDRPPSPRRDRPPSPRRDHPPSPRRDRPPSPRRDRPPSPRRDRPHSPGRDRLPSPRRDRPHSPQMYRPRSPYDWRSRSPPRGYGPPPPDWGRRSPPHWVRRSPPRYGPPRGPSPPRGYWGPPPPEWDRYRGRPPSPPRWGPPPPHPWDRRGWPMDPRVKGPPFPPRPHAPPPKPESSAKAPSPTINLESRQEARGDEGILPPGEDKDDEIDSFDLPDYDPELSLGQKYVVAVSGFFCKICHKFYNSEVSAKITHCKSKTHYDKFAKWLSEKQVASLVRKRLADDKPDTEDQPPAKQLKQSPKLDEEKASEPSDSESKYDPFQPTMDVPSTSTQTRESNVEKEKVALETDDTEDSSEATKEQNGITDYNSDSETLITSETKKDSGDFVEATLYNIRKLKVNQLKANLEKRGMKSTGLKPLLLKRLEKVLTEEESAASAAQGSEQKTEDEQKENEEQTGGDVEELGKVYVMKVMESDVEPSNRKSQWITDREMERELSQLEGVKKVVSVSSEKRRVFNGRRTNVEWTIKLVYDGEIDEDGLQFFMPSHQQLPFTAMLLEETA